MDEPIIKLVHTAVDKLSISDLRVAIDKVKQDMEFLRDGGGMHRSPAVYIQRKAVRDALMKELSERVSDLYYVTVEGKKL